MQVDLIFQKLQELQLIHLHCFLMENQQQNLPFFRFIFHPFFVLFT